MLVLAADMVTTDRPWTHGDDDLASRVRLFAGCWTTVRLDPTANTRDAILRLHRAATTIACTNCTPNSKPGNDNEQRPLWTAPSEPLTPLLAGPVHRSRSQNFPWRPSSESWQRSLPPEPIASQAISGLRFALLEAGRTA
jgi:hypothetical protein